MANPVVRSRVTAGRRGQRHQADPESGQLPVVLDHRLTYLTLDQQALIATQFVLFAEAARDRRTNLELLQMLMESCIALVSDAECTIVGRQDDGHLHMITYSSDRALVTDRSQLNTQGGPIHRMFAGVRSGLDISLINDESLPDDYKTLAMLAGFNNLHAIPITAGTELIAVLNMYSQRDTPIGWHLLGWINALARAAALSISNLHSVSELNIENEQLRAALLNRVTIEQAKGLVAARLDVEPEIAFDFIRQYARSHHVQVRKVCADLLSKGIPARALRSERAPVLRKAALP
jgi:transcriptional regulator with GAF, ATPase, and Fis domain